MRKRRSGSRWSRKIRRALTKLPERIAISSSQPSRSWIGSTIVVLGSVFLLLTFNEGRSIPHQPVIDALFHNWFAMGIGSIAIWLARRESFGRLPSLMRGLSGLILSFFILFSLLGVLTSQVFWDLLKPFGVVQDNAQPAAVFGLIGLWGICFVGFFVRVVFRWFRRRYEHQGLAVGFGPVNFYFRRRRTF